MANPRFSLDLEETPPFPALSTVWVWAARAENLREALQIPWVASFLGHQAMPWCQEPPVLPRAPRPGFGYPQLVLTHLLEHHKLILRRRALVDLIFVPAGKWSGGMLSPGGPVSITQPASADHGK